MMHIFEIKTWWIAHNNADTVHYGVADSGALGTGQPFYERYETEQEWIDRLLELGVDMTEVTDE